MSVLLAVLLVVVVAGVAVAWRIVALHRGLPRRQARPGSQAAPAAAAPGLAFGARLRHFLRPLESSAPPRPVARPSAAVSLVPASGLSGPCDCCPAAAAVEVLLSNGGRLQLCAHHSRALARPLSAQGAVLVGAQASWQ